MISCQTFRATVRPGSDDAGVLEHLRSCDACLDHALTIDPDFFFRAMGGGEMVPPGGVDSFVSDVMAQVRSRQAESSATHRIEMRWYLRAAAAVMFAIAGAAGVYQFGHRAVAPPSAVPIVTTTQTVHGPVATKAVIETYQSRNATIVEVPSTSASDAKIVMIYDESLPADL